MLTLPPRMFRRLDDPARLAPYVVKERTTRRDPFDRSEAEFTPKTVQTEEERVKLVYSVKVRITGDRGYDLKPGMPADVVIPLAEAS